MSSQAVRPWRDKDRLRELYVKKGLKQEEIAEKWGCSQNTVSKWVRKHNLETQFNYDSGEWDDEELLYDMYIVERMSIRDIADEFDVHHGVIRYFLRKHDIETRNRFEERRKRPASHFICNDGYEVVTSAGKEIGVHRLVAIAHEGIDSVKDMEIHHKNRIPWDNRAENLEILTTAEHAKRHQ